jgi:hypothetical protein
VLLGREIASEPVTPIEDAPDGAALGQVRPHRAGLCSVLQLRLAFGLLQHGDRLLHERAVDVREHVVAIQCAVADRRVRGLVRRHEERREILAGQVLRDRRLLFRAGVGQAQQCRRDVDVRGHRLAALATGMRRVHDDQRNVVLLAIGCRPFRMQPMGTIEIAVVRS